MPIIKSDYKAPFWALGKHSDTILPFVFRKDISLTFEREKVTTPDADFLNLDWSCVGSSKLVIISHGIAGHSRLSNVKGMAKAMNEAGWDALAWNYRGCGEEANHQRHFYHAGCIADITYVINHAIKTAKYEEIYLIGISFGGHLTASYLYQMRNRLPKEIARAAVFSVPFDLRGIPKLKNRWINRLYTKNLINSWKSNLIAKAEKFPDLLENVNWKKIKTVHDFDNHFTAPIHGFVDAHHYYDMCSLDDKLDLIPIPMLVVNAANDPFLTPGCFPIEACKNSNNVYLEIPKRGGHMGFVNKRYNDRYWSEERAVQFFNVTLQTNEMSA